MQGGYGALLASLAKGLDGSRVEMRLRSVVRAVRWKRGAVEVEGTCSRDEGGGVKDEGGRRAKRSPPARGGVAREVRRGGRKFLVTARRAIITLPLGVLQAPARAPGAVRFTPPLTEKRAALAGLASGTVIKAALLFRTAFWEQLDDGRYRGVSFFHSPGTRFPTFWTALPEPVPLLVAWAGGPNADRLAKAATPAIVREAAASFASILPLRGGVEEHLAAAWVHHWQQDPFARGAYSYVTAGGHGARHALARPLQDTLFFAGEAADDAGEHGTVAGALQSGERAALQALAQG